jgi:hypothetical protein
MAKSKPDEPDLPLPASGGAMTPEQMRAQQQSAEREPKPVPLTRPVDAEGRPLDRPPVGPAAAGLPVPRVIHQNERAPEGLRRFKIRCTNYEAQPFRYILASNEEEAKRHYLKATGLDVALRRQGDKGLPPDLSVREQPD